jgi:hypothetical protein
VLLRDETSEVRNEGLFHEGLHDHIGNCCSCNIPRKFPRPKNGWSEAKVGAPGRSSLSLQVETFPGLLSSGLINARRLAEHIWVVKCVDHSQGGYDLEYISMTF